MQEMMRKAYMPPFQVIGNLYYVGNKLASSHLISTSDGLILLDSGYDAMMDMLLDNIHLLGFDERQIRYIIHSHGHIDHLGATKRLRDVSGAKTVIGRADRDYANGLRQLTYAKELGLSYDTAFEPDILLDDKDIVRLGNTVIHALHTPGHTEGTMSYFFCVENNGHELVVGTHGGIGINTMSRAYLKAYGLPLSLRWDFLEGLERLHKIHVDVLVPNHQDQWNTIERYQEKVNGNDMAFVDAEAWPKYLDMARLRLTNMLREEEDAL